MNSLQEWSSSSSYSAVLFPDGPINTAAVDAKLALVREEKSSRRHERILRHTEFDCATAVGLNTVNWPVHRSVQGTDEKDSFSWFERSLGAFRKLEAGWDGYSAPAPSDKTTFRAGELLTTLWAANIEPAHMGPSAIGGIGFTFENEEYEFVVEYLNDGEILKTIIDSTDENAEVKVELVGAIDPAEEIVESLRELNIV